MSPFWKSLFEHLEQCGRNATLFIVALAVPIGVLIVIGILKANDLDQYIIPVLSGLGLVLFIWVCTAVRRAWNRARQGWQSSPLSDDELRVARSRLVRERSGKNRGPG